MYRQRRRCAHRTGSSTLATPGLSSSITGGFNINCNGGTDAAATTTPAERAYTYAWSNGQTADTATGLPAGPTPSWSPTPTQIPSQASLDFNADLHRDHHRGYCGAGLSNGSATSSLRGNRAPTPAWSDGQNAPPPRGLPQAPPRVVTDAGGCSDSSTALIGEPARPVLATNSTQHPLFCGPDRTIDINVAGAVPYTYDWRQGGTSFPPHKMAGSPQEPIP